MNETKTRPLAERIERALAAIVGDLSLLVSLCAARVIVWRTLRRRDVERAKAHAERRKQFGRVAAASDTDEGVVTRGGDGSASAGGPLPWYVVR